MSVQALKNGAIDFLEKPYRQEILRERIEQALVRSKAIREKIAKIDKCNERYNCLSPREKQVMAILIDNLGNTTNKIIAEALNISPRTVEDHRAKNMLKMQAKSLFELVEMAKLLSANNPMNNLDQIKM